VRALCAERCVVAVAWVNHGGIVVDVEHPRSDVRKQPVEIARLPRLAYAAGEQAVTGEQLRGVAGGGSAQGQRDRAGRVAAQMDDIEDQVADLDGVAVLQK